MSARFQPNYRVSMIFYPHTINNSHRIFLSSVLLFCDNCTTRKFRTQRFNENHSFLLLRILSKEDKKYCPETSYTSRKGGFYSFLFHYVNNLDNQFLHICSGAQSTRNKRRFCHAEKELHHWCLDLG